MQVFLEPYPGHVLEAPRPLRRTVNLLILSAHLPASPILVYIESFLSWFLISTLIGLKFPSYMTSRILLNNLPKENLF
jgi:hypothetical protein